MDDIATRFRHGLKWYRHQRELSQGQLARLVGLSIGVIRHIEAGRSEPTLSVALRLAAALRVSIPSILAAPVPTHLPVKVRSGARPR